MISFSVAICTRNRADSLRHTLHSLAQANLRLTDEDRARWELLLVDNGSSDHTQEVAESFRDTLPLHQVSESRPGLSRARNAALGHFRGAWLVFTDDDAEVETDYLLAVTSAVARHEDMDYFGGRSHVNWLCRRPRWLTDPDLPYIKGLLCHFDEGDEDYPVPLCGPLPFGVNMGVRRSLTEAVDGFRNDLGPGTPARGEETEYLQRARAAGFRGWYLGSVRVWHRADPQRFELVALYLHGIAKGRGHGLMNPAARHGTFSREARQLLAALWQAIKGKGGWMRVCIVNAGIERGLRQVRTLESSAVNSDHRNRQGPGR